MPITAGIWDWLFGSDGISPRDVIDVFGPGPIAIPTTLPGGNVACEPPLVFDPAAGICVSPGSPVDVSTNGVVTTQLSQILGVQGAAPMTSIRRRCGKAKVLGIDGLCYPKALLPGRSKLRENKKPLAPPISRKQWRALKGSASAKEEAEKVAKEAGLHVSKSAPKSSAAANKRVKELEVELAIARAHHHG